MAKAQQKIHLFKSSILINNWICQTKVEDRFEGYLIPEKIETFAEQVNKNIDQVKQSDNQSLRNKLRKFKNHFHSQNVSPIHIYQGMNNDSFVLERE